VCFITGKPYNQILQGPENKKAGEMPASVPTYIYININKMAVSITMEIIIAIRLAFLCFSSSCVTMAYRVLVAGLDVKP
jgi:hypothetical protein